MKFSRFQVRYEIVGRGKASKYFQIDPDIGLLQVRNDLRKEPDSEYVVGYLPTYLVFFFSKTLVHFVNLN